MYRQETIENEAIYMNKLSNVEASLNNSKGLNRLKREHGRSGALHGLATKGYNQYKKAEAAGNVSALAPLQKRFEGLNKQGYRAGFDHPGGKSLEPNTPYKEIRQKIGRVGATDHLPERARAHKFSMMKKDLAKGNISAGSDPARKRYHMITKKHPPGSRSTLQADVEKYAAGNY